MANDYRKTQVRPASQLIRLIFALMAVWGVISFLKRLPYYPAVTQSQQSNDSGSKIGSLLDGVGNPFTTAKRQLVCSKETAPASAKGFAPQQEGFEQDAEVDARLSMRDRLSRHYKE